MPLKTLKQRGDTIVEVMLCLAIMGAALALAYGIATRSLTQVREAQERGEALKLAEEQAERIKQSIAINPNIIFDGSSIRSFCIDKNLNVTNIASATDCPSDSNPDYYVGVIYFKDRNSIPGNEFYIAAGRAQIGRTAGSSPSELATINYKVY